METHSCDVLVLGAGPGGAAAALAAARGGADVTIVDSRGEVGGNGAYSTGYIAFADIPLQREHGIDDSPEALLADMCAEVERQRARFDPEFDVDLARLFAEESRNAYSFLDDLGFEFGRFIPRPRQHTVDRMTVVVNPAQFGDTLAAELETAGVDLQRYQRVTELIRTGGEVIGATVSQKGKEERTLCARRGVIVALGGYQASAELRAKYQPTQDPRSPYPGLDNVKGDGHVLMEAIGAELVNMHMIPQLVRMPSRFLEEVIAVNGWGERFEDETGPYDERLERFLEQPEQIGYYIGDSVGLERVAQLVAEAPQRAKWFPTMEAVARAIGCEVDVLLGTMGRWNATVESGAERDPDFGRVIFPEPRHGISTPPFGVIPMVPGIAGSVGGARVGLDMGVLDCDGARIPGLYAVGDCVGTVNPATGLGGIHLSTAVTLGLVAGRAAAIAPALRAGNLS
jgi:succinate dehydrogenase/fumarate reductase flavoprotein subunit